MDEMARDPRFVPGIYNYCDQWCQRCALTSRCMNYALAMEVEAAFPNARAFRRPGFDPE